MLVIFFLSFVFLLVYIPHLHIFVSSYLELEVYYNLFGMVYLKRKHLQASLSNVLGQLDFIKKQISYHQKIIKIKMKMLSSMGCNLASSGPD